MSEDQKQYKGKNLELLNRVIKMFEDEDDNLVGFVCSFSEKTEDGVQTHKLTFGDKLSLLWISTGLHETVKKNSAGVDDE